MTSEISSFHTKASSDKISRNKHYIEIFLLLLLAFIQLLAKYYLEME
jgi:hypothetical protein